MNAMNYEAARYYPVCQLCQISQTPAPQLPPPAPHSICLLFCIGLNRIRVDCRAEIHPSCPTLGQWPATEAVKAGAGGGVRPGAVPPAAPLAGRGAPPGLSTPGARSEEPPGLHDRCPGSWPELAGAAADRQW